MDIPEKLYARLLQLKKETLLSVMIEALSIMQYHNGRSLADVICLATQANVREDDNGQVYYKLPSKKQIEELYR